MLWCGRLSRSAVKRWSSCSPRVTGLIQNSGSQLDSRYCICGIYGGVSPVWCGRCPDGHSNTSFDTNSVCAVAAYEMHENMWTRNICLAKFYLFSGPKLTGLCINQSRANRLNADGLTAEITATSDKQSSLKCLLFFKQPRRTLSGISASIASDVHSQADRVCSSNHMQPIMERFIFSVFFRTNLLESQKWQQINRQMHECYRESMELYL